jgi:hypothetical protein
LIWGKLFSVKTSEIKTGDEVILKLKVLRVDGERLDAQTANGQLIQTDKSNVVEHKAILNSPEKSQIHRQKNRNK